MFSLLYINFPGVAKTTIIEKKLTQKVLTIHNSYKMPKLEEKLKKEIRFKTQPIFEAFSFFCHPKLLLERHGVTKLVVTAKQVSSQILLLHFKNACEQYQKNQDI